MRNARFNFRGVGNFLGHLFLPACVGAVFFGTLAIVKSSEPDEVAGAAQGEESQPAQDGRQQRTKDLFINRDGRSYALWEGLIVEELDNDELSGSMASKFDQNIYDFDMGVVLHSSSAGISQTPFNQLMINGALPAHLERIRTIGCELGQAFNERANDGKGAVPADVVSYVARHCPAPAVQ